MIGKIFSDHPRTSVWPDSSTSLRPLRNSVTRRSMPLATRPISELTTKTPKSTTKSDCNRSGQPTSSCMAAGSSARIMFCHTASMTLGCSS